MLTSEKEYFGKFFTNEALVQEELTYKYFEECSFHNCDFTEANLRYSKFIDCSFVDCNLSLAKLNFSKFNSVTFSNCKIIGVDWTVVAWPSIGIMSPLNFEKCILNDSSFFGLALQDAEFVECKIHNADFGESNCEKADFSYSDLQKTLFHRANLGYANFEGAINYSIDVFNTNIKHARFSLPEAASLLDYLEIEIS